MDRKEREKGKERIKEKNPPLTMKEEIKHLVSNGKSLGLLPKPCACSGRPHIESPLHSTCLCNAMGRLSTLPQPPPAGFSPLLHHLL